MNESSSKKITHILGAELSKLISLPMIWLTLIGTFILNLILVAAFIYAELQAETGSNVLDIGLASMSYLQVGFIILGILAACSEYVGGQIQTTLIAVPWRGLQLSTKHLALAIISLPAAFITVSAGALYAFMMIKDIATELEISTMIKTIAGATGYLTLTTLLSVAIGSLLKRTIPALVVLLSYYFIASPLLRGFLSDIKNYLPDTAGSYMYTSSASEGINGLTSIQGTGILMLWTFILIAVAVVFYRKRDA
ncbi:ABC transporter permease [Ornithinibacillus sp. 4-3]|uniref:ABC transporter permease n=1 Tax=Ornithinibacillus sp. 4-3 TaxID=3231488 RepID=A0AB39HUS1_9BACI